MSAKPTPAIVPTPRVLIYLESGFSKNYKGSPWVELPLTWVNWMGDEEAMQAVKSLILVGVN